MNKNKMSYNVFQSQYNTFTPTQIQHKINSIEGNSTRRPTISANMQNSIHSKRQQTENQQKRKGRISEHPRKKTKPTNTKGKNRKKKNDACNNEMNIDTSFLEGWPAPSLLRNNSLSSITHERTDSQETKDQEEIKRLKKIIEDMTNKKKTHRHKKKYIVSQQFEWNVKQIVKEHLYPKVKFITSAKQMESITDKKSIGYWFLKHYRTMELQDKIYVDEEFSDHDIWKHAKNIVYTTIKQKRGTVQTEIKKGWIGKCAIMH